MLVGCRLIRNILDKPRVTRFPVEFDPVEPVPDLAQVTEAMNGQAFLADGGAAMQQAAGFGQQPQVFEDQQPQVFQGQQQQLLGQRQEQNGQH